MSNFFRIFVIKPNTMKKIITLLLVFITVYSYGQFNIFKKKSKSVDTSIYPRELIIPQHLTEFKIVYVDNKDILIEFDKEKVIEEYILLLDSIREYQFGEDLPKLIHDKRLDSAALYHNIYLSNMIDTTEDVDLSLILGHDQTQTFGTSIHIGDNPIIPSFFDRVKKYCGDSVDPHGEVCQGGMSLSFISMKGMTEKDIARKILYGFYNSPKHMEWIKSKSYVLSGANLYTQQRGNNIYWWFTSLSGYKVITTTHKTGKFYYPNNPLDLPEYYEKKTTVFNW